MAVGIYRIKNLITERSYIGQSHNIKRRFKEHYNRAFDFSNKQYYDSCYCDIRRYGIDNFIFEILEECSCVDLDEREIFWINYFDTYKNGYNETKGGDSGWHYTVLDDVKLEEIIFLLKEGKLNNSDIGAKYNISDQAVSNINMGKSCVKDGVLYPIRPRHKKKYFCSDCGKEITNKATRCRDCSSFRQRRVVRPDKEVLHQLVEQKGFFMAGEQFGVSGVTIKKWHYN